MNIFNSLLPQLVKYDVHTTRKINSIHAIFYHILSLSCSMHTILSCRLFQKHCKQCPKGVQFCLAPYCCTSNLQKSGPIL